MKGLKKGILIAILFIALIIGASSIVVTHENEYKLIRQFGEISHVVDEAGISFKIPFIQSVDTLPRQTLLYDMSSSDVITSDKKTMICDSYILWRITDPVAFARTLNSSIAAAEGRLDPIIYNSTKNVISILGGMGAMLKQSSNTMASIGNTAFRVSANFSLNFDLIDNICIKILSY